MQIAGMICEYNPFHLGHLALVEMCIRDSSYIFLAQIEIQDIINIIEGIRYHLASEEIQKRLTVADFSRKEA